jgi:hypothetical protein
MPGKAITKVIMIEEIYSIQVTDDGYVSRVKARGDDKYSISAEVKENEVYVIRGVANGVWEIVGDNTEICS